MNIEKLKRFYKDRIEQTKKNYHFTKQKIHFWGTIRLIIVLLTGISIYIFRNQDFIALFAISILPIIFLFWSFIKHNKMIQKKLFLETSITSDQNELHAIDYNFNAFDGAKERINGMHHFSLDLDIFGDKSLFQSINRTCTAYGKELLADWFENQLNTNNEILQRQKAIIELSKNSNLRHQFIVTGLVNPSKFSDLDEIRKFVQYPSYFSKNKLWKALSYLLPLTWICTILLACFNIIPSIIITWIFIITFIISESQLKKINKLQNLVGKKMKIFSTYADLIQLIEKNDVESELLKKIKSYFTNKEKPASTLIKQLAQLSGELDQRTNMLAHLIFNPILLWDVRKAISIEQWKETNGDTLEDWIKAIGIYDAISSLSTFYFNHQEYIFPSINEEYFEITGKSLGHPLLHRDICVKNDIEVTFNPYFMIVTGANMAGKSTYLRTIGVNFLLACIGAPVCAESLTLCPAQLVTSLRTSDSLIENESYFFAELKRLKMIIDDLNEGKQMFIILDEILKGTNSIDKQKGSLALIEQFISLNTCGIIATHDLLLGSLENEFPSNVKNYCFEADITNDELTFSYQLRTGIAQNMNACFLMKKMGITV